MKKRALLSCLFILPLIIFAQTFCAPISTLDCNGMVVSLPLTLDFSGAVPNTLVEKNGIGTGFTAVLDHSELRRSSDLPISNPDVNGFEPLLLTLGEGTLKIRSQAGIAYLDPPASSNNNNQVNSLGVGLDNITGPLTIETTMLAINTGGGAAQAGIWFGFDEDNFVKLNVIDDHVEMRREVGGLSASGSGSTDQIQVNNLGVRSQNVSLRLVVDPGAMTMSGFYSINGGAFIRLAKIGLDRLVLPPEYLAGRTLNVVNSGISFAGIYATNRNGTQFTASFEDFSVTGQPSERALSFDVSELNFLTEENTVIAGQSAILAASSGNPTVIFSDDPDAGEWLSFPATNVPGEIAFAIKAGVSPGTYSTTVFAVDEPDLGYTNAGITINLEITAAANDFSANINFSNASTVPPAGYGLDSGLGYGDRGNGFKYGWVAANGFNPLDLSANARNRRNGSVGVLQNTLIHMQYADTGGSTGNATEGIWEMELPNGTYNVRVGVGDPIVDDPGTEPNHSINVEGVTLINKYKPVGTSGDPGRFTAASTTVTVSDGKLTIEAAGGFNTKINYVEISGSTVVQPPKVVGVIPFDGATDISVTPTISANDLFLPNKDENGISGVNNNTITNSTVKLYRQGSAVQVGATVNGTGGGDAIILVPNLPLEANTAYVFEISGVEDTAGVPFDFFTSGFTTRNVSTEGATDLDNVSFVNTGSVATGVKYSSLAIGPDHKLYGLSIGGDIRRWDINSDGTLVNEATLTSWKSAYGNRTSVGLVFDPAATAGNLIAYVSHDSGGLSDAPAWDGKISRLTGANLEREDLVVTNLPRSKRDHLTNSLVFKPGEPNVIYFNQGSNSAAGAPDNAWGNRKERLLSAATLRLDLDKLPKAQWPLNAKTTMDPIAINNVNINSPTLISTTGTFTEEGQTLPDEGTYNPYYVNAPLTLFATGVRNAYDLLWHTNGQLYIPANGTAGGSNAPASVNGTRRPDGTFYNHSNPSKYPAIPASNSNNVQRDWLFRIDPNSTLGYYGHPNPLRGEFVLNRGDADVMNAAYNGVQPDINYRGAAFDFEFNKSPNGVIEYRSDSENGNLQGALLIVRYSGGSDIVAVVPDGPWGDISTFKEGIPGFTGFQDPLDLTEDVATGNIYVSDYGRSEIILLKPSQQASPKPVIALSVDRVTGDAVTAGANTYTEQVILSNLGNAILNNITAQISGVNGDQFRVTGLPASLNVQNSDSFEVIFDPTSNGPKFAQLIISGTDAAPSVLTLRGLGKNGTNEPSLQWIFDTYLGNGVVNTGDTNASTSIIDLPGASSYNDALGDEVDIQQFERAVDAPVSIEVLSVYGPEANPTVGFGWYPSGNTAATKELFTVENAIPGNNQTLNPILNGTLEFDPGVQSFGFYNRWPFFNNRHLYSENALNKFSNAIPHHIRVYELPGEKNAYIITTEEHVSGFDYQDIVVIARNIRPFNDGPTLACTPISTRECNELEAGLPFNLFFSGDEGGLSNTGFTMVDDPSARIAADGPISNVNVPGYEPNRLSFSNGHLVVRANNGIAFSTNDGGAGQSTDVNSQINSLGVGLNANSYGNFSITTTLLNPYEDATGNSEQAGIWFGLDEDNFVKLNTTNGGIVEVRTEVAGVSGAANAVTATGITGLHTSTVSLRLYIDLENNLIAGFYSLNGNLEVEVGSLPLPSVYLSGNVDYGNLSFAGVYATKRRELTAEVNYSFDDFAITPDSLTSFDPVRINFSLPGDVPPNGYLVDSGLGFGDRGNTRSYGWLTTNGQTPLNLSRNARNRKIAGIGILKNTLVHMQYDDVAGGNGTNGVNIEGIWEITIPNGVYTISVNVGDPGLDSAGDTPGHTINVEGTNIINNYVPTGQAGSATRFTTGSATVSVNDGRLTVDAFGGFNTKINSLEIVQTGAGENPIITAIFDGSSIAPDVYNGSVAITLEATDRNDSGIASLEYILDAAPAVSYTGPITVSAAGAHLLRVTAEDGNANVTQKSFGFTITGSGGAIIALENMTKIPGTTRGFPADDYYTFYRHRNPRSVIPHDSNVLRINNGGTGDLIVTGVAISGTNAYTYKILPKGTEPISLPITIPPGSFRDLEITFTADPGGGNNAIFKETIQITSNADNTSGGIATLHGGFTPQPEGGDEINAQQVFDAFGFQSSMLSIVNNNGTISPPNKVPFRPSSNFPDEDNINAGYEGDMILADAFVQADPAKPVRGIQLSALHGPGTNNAKFVELNGTGTVGDINFSHGSEYYQTLLPKKSSGVINSDMANTISSPFRIAVANYLSTGGNNINGNRPDLLGVRLYKVIDHNGNVIPNEYIVLQDFVQNGCGAGSANCDWNDNTFYFINIRPQAVPTAQPLDAILVNVGAFFSEEVSATFDKGYAGNKLAFAATYNNGNLPPWMTFNTITGTLSGTPPTGTTGNFEIRIVATDLNDLTASSSITVVVNEGLLAVADKAAAVQKEAPEVDQIITLSTSLDPTAEGAIESFDVRIYPNPGVADITLEVPKWSGGITAIYAHDVQGRLVASYAPDEYRYGDAYMLPIHQLEAGVYYLIIKNGKGLSTSKRIIVKN